MLCIATNRKILCLFFKQKKNYSWKTNIHISIKFKGEKYFAEKNRKN